MIILIFNYIEKDTAEKKKKNIFKNNEIKK